MLGPHTLLIVSSVGILALGAATKSDKVVLLCEQICNNEFVQTVEELNKDVNVHFWILSKHSANPDCAVLQDDQSSGTVEIKINNSTNEACQLLKAIKKPPEECTSGGSNAVTRAEVFLKENLLDVATLGSVLDCKGKVAKMDVAKLKDKAELNTHGTNVIAFAKGCKPQTSTANVTVQHDSTTQVTIQKELRYKDGSKATYTCKNNAAATPSDSACSGSQWSSKVEHVNCAGESATTESSANSTATFLNDTHGMPSDEKLENAKKKEIERILYIAIGCVGGIIFTSLIILAAVVIKRRKLRSHRQPKKHYSKERSAGSKPRRDKRRRSLAKSRTKTAEKTKTETIKESRRPTPVPLYTTRPVTKVQQAQAQPSHGKSVTNLTRRKSDETQVTERIKTRTATKRTETTRRPGMVGTPTKVRSTHVIAQSPLKPSTEPIVYEAR